MSKMDMTLELELGCTGGEEDGVDNSHMDQSALYTQPEDVAYAYPSCPKSARASPSLPPSATYTVFTSRVT
ncbi:class II fructose-bisphosphate aldolase [Shigella flexneri]